MLVDLRVYKLTLTLSQTKPFIISNCFYLGCVCISLSLSFFVKVYFLCISLSPSSSRLWSISGVSVNKHRAVAVKTGGFVTLKIPTPPPSIPSPSISLHGKGMAFLCVFLAGRKSTGDILDLFDFVWILAISSNIGSFQIFEKWSGHILAR